MIAQVQASLRPQTARWLALALACALAIAQLLFAGHALKHVDEAGQADCALCLAGSSLDHAATQSPPAPPAARTIQAATDVPPHPARPTRLHRANARAPPTSHA